MLILIIFATNFRVFYILTINFAVKSMNTFYSDDYSKKSSDDVLTVHRGAFCQFTFWWIYYYGSNESTGKESGKTHLCAMFSLFSNFCDLFSKHEL